MSSSTSELGAKAQIDFHCFDPECDGVVKFNLADIAGRDFQAVCPKCHWPYALDAALKDKLGRMLELITAIRKAEDILGDSNVSDFENPEDKDPVPVGLIVGCSAAGVVVIGGAVWLVVWLRKRKSLK